MRVRLPKPENPGGLGGRATATDMQNFQLVSNHLQYIVQISKRNNEAELFLGVRPPRPPSAHVRHNIARLVEKSTSKAQECQRILGCNPLGPTRMIRPCAHVTENISRFTAAERVDVGWMHSHRHGSTGRHGELEQHPIGGGSPQ